MEPVGGPLQHANNPKISPGFFPYQEHRSCRSLSNPTYLPLATSHGNVDETAGVLETLHGAALGLLLLLLRLDL